MTIYICADRDHECPDNPARACKGCHKFPAAPVEAPQPANFDSLLEDVIFKGLCDWHEAGGFPGNPEEIAQLAQNLRCVIVDELPPFASRAASPAEPATVASGHLLAELAKHPRWQLDNDIQKFGQPGKWRVWKLIGSRHRSTKVRTLGDGDTPAEAIRAAIASTEGAERG